MPPAAGELPSSAALPQRQKVVLVMDLVESVRLMAEDERAVIDRWRGFVRHATGQVLPAHGGRLVKSLGDGIMAEFDAAPAAVAAALALHRHFEAANAGLPPGRRLLLRAGLHASQVYVDDLDIYGTGVNLAARVAGLAGPGETMVTSQVRDQLSDGLDAELQDMGECHLKHVAQPLRVYRVGPCGPMPTLRSPDAYATPLEPTVAVMAFTLFGLPAESAAMQSQILAEELINRLALCGELRVISRLSTEAVAGRGLQADRIGRLLGAQFVLSGRAMASGGRVRVFAEMAEVRTNTVVWAQAFTAGGGDSWCHADDLLEELAGAVLAAVRARELRRSRLQPIPTLGSYSLLMGAIALMHRTSARDFELARALLDDLVRRHAQLARPHAWLANWHALRVTQGFSDNPDRDSAEALRCAARALELEPECSLALAIDGILQANLRRDMATAVRRLDAAVEANPNDSLAWLFRGGVHGFIGDGAPAQAASLHATALSPLDPLRHYYDMFSATAAVGAGNYRQAIGFAQRSVRVNSLHPSAYRLLALAQVLSGDTAAGRRTVQALRQLLPGYTVDDFQAHSPLAVHPRAGEFARALADAGLPARG